MTRQRYLCHSFGHAEITIVSRVASRATKWWGGCSFRVWWTKEWLLSSWLDVYSLRMFSHATSLAATQPGLKSVRKTKYDVAEHKSAILLWDIRAEYRGLSLFHCGPRSPPKWRSFITRGWRDSRSFPLVRFRPSGCIINFLAPESIATKLEHVIDSGNGICYS